MNIRSHMLKARSYWFVILGPFILFAYPILMGRSLFWGTPALQFIPWRVYAFERILQGQMPFLNDFVGLNAPLLANYQLAIFYPLTWFSFPFFVWGGAPLLAWSHTLLLCFHLALSGTGMAKLIKQWSGNGLGMVVGGLAFCLSGYWVARSGFFSIIWCGAWLPWEMYLASALFRLPITSAKSTFIKLVACFTLQLLAGHAQLAWYSIGIVVLWSLVLVLLEAKNRRRWVLLTILIAAICFAAGLSAVQLIPTAEYLIQSQRSTRVDYTKALSYSFWPWHLFNFIAPDLFGSPIHGDYWGYLSYWEDAVYIGILPLIGAVSTLFYLIKSFIHPENRLEKDLRVLLIFGWITIEIVFVMALGYNTPLYPFLYNHIPTFSMFNAPTRLMVIIVFFLTWFSGIGIGFWKRPSGKERKWIKRLLVVGLAIVLGASLGKITVPKINQTVFYPVIFSGVFFTISFILILNIPFEQKYNQRRQWSRLVYCFVLLDLLMAGIFVNPYIDMSYFKNNEQMPADGNDRGRIFIDQKNEYVLKFKKYLRFNDFSAPGDWNRMRLASLPNINMLDHVYSASNFDPLLLGRYQNWLDAFDEISHEQQEHMLKLMNVKSRLMTNLRGSDIGVTAINVVGGSFINWSNCATIVSNPDMALKETIAAHEGDILVESDQVPPDLKTCQKTQADIIEKYHSAERVIIEIRTKNPGWIWISYLNYPGWSIKLDDQIQPVYPINYLFLGTQVPAGSHVVEFNYVPTSFYWGLGISFISLVLLLGLSWMLRFGSLD